MTRAEAPRCVSPHQHMHQPPVIENMPISARDHATRNNTQGGLCVRHQHIASATTHKQGLGPACIIMFGVGWVSWPNHSELNTKLGVRSALCLSIIDMSTNYCDLIKTK